TCPTLALSARCSHAGQIEYIAVAIRGIVDLRQLSLLTWVITRVDMKIDKGFMKAAGQPAHLPVKTPISGRIQLCDQLQGFSKVASLNLGHQVLGLLSQLFLIII